MPDNLKDKQAALKLTIWQLQVEDLFGRLTDQQKDYLQELLVRKNYIRDNFEL